MTRLVDSALADGFRDGRSAERSFAATAAARKWAREQWQVRYASLVRQVEAADMTVVTGGPEVRNFLFGRLSIVENILEGESIT